MSNIIIFFILLIPLIPLLLMTAITFNYEIIDYIDDAIEYIKRKIFKKDQLEAKFEFLSEILYLQPEFLNNIEKLRRLIYQLINQKKYEELRCIECDLDNEIWLMKEVLSNQINSNHSFSISRNDFYPRRTRKTSKMHNEEGYIMTIGQLSIFDCDISIQSNDCIFQQLKNLQVGQTVQVQDLQVTRDKRFYIVTKKEEFEELFRDIHYCYRFINNKLLDSQELEK